MISTVGQLLINESLPPDLRDPHRVLDKKGVRELLQQVYDRYPERYRDIAQQLMDVGAEAAYVSGTSASLEDLRPPPDREQRLRRITQRLRKLQGDPRLNAEQRDQAVVNLLLGEMDEFRQSVYEEGRRSGNALVRQSLSGASGSRGTPANISSLRGADLLVLDHKDRPVPVPIMRSYSEGLSPAEYFAAAYGTRKGVVTLKTATAKAGFLGKQLNNAAARLLITDEDPLPDTGLPVSTDDDDNEGAVLARDYGRFSAGTVLTPDILKVLRRKHDEILVHSPISSGGRGVSQKAAGFRERGGWSPIGDNIGLAAAQAISEPLSQGMLAAKHHAGVLRSAKRRGELDAFKGLNQLIQVPKSFQYAATLAEADGTVEKIETAPQGGRYVWVGGLRHYVHPDLELLTPKGSRVEAGDALSEGVPNPADVVRHKHIGEGRRYLAERLQRTLADSGVRVHRRNAEVLARGLINHVRVTDLNGVEEALPDDLLDYDDLALRYVPRPGSADLPPERARQWYLERPVLHYSIGTRITPSVIKRMKKHGVKRLTVHEQPPPFAPHMVRAMETTLYDPDFVRRLQGFYIGKGLLSAAQRGGRSEIHGPHWGHALAEARGFGQELATKAIY